jgi:hypothetical protein
VRPCNPPRHRRVGLARQRGSRPSVAAGPQLCQGRVDNPLRDPPQGEELVELGIESAVLRAQDRDADAFVVNRRHVGLT